MKKPNENVGMSDKAGVVIMDKDKKIVKQISGGKKNVEPNRKIHG